MQTLFVVLAVVASIGLALGASAVTLDLLFNLLPRSAHPASGKAASSPASPSSSGL